LSTTSSIWDVFAFEKGSGNFLAVVFGADLADLECSVVVDLAVCGYNVRELAEGQKSSIVRYLRVSISDVGL